ncbi:MAG: RHS repeat-associated core domain-containing protein, partial [Paucibacter sp.]|nr:RHS repeat-associated core domain-containing protein [Roseateles sp.]
HVNDPDTGLVYMQQRYYDPIAGRFLSVDPVVTDANTGKGFGLYTYVDNSPYGRIDPDGRVAVAAFVPAIIDAIATAVASNTGVAVVGIAGGVALGAAINSSGAQGGEKGPASASAPAAAEGSPSASGAASSAEPKESGSYTNTHGSGKTYDG